MPHILHKVAFKTSPEEAFQTVSTIQGLSRWWTEEVSGRAEPGQNLHFTFRDLSGEVKGGMTMKVEKQIPSELVEWTCLEGPPEWVGTSLTFNFSQVDDYVVLLFSHRNWKEEVEFMHHCSTKWAVFLMSLKELLEKGKGHPSPYDVKIDNWN